MGRRNLIRSNRGYSLIEILVSVAILTTVSFGFMTMVSGQQREIRAMDEKLEIQDVARVLQNHMSVDSFCGCLLRGRTFDTSQPLATWDFNIATIPSIFSQPIPAPPAPCAPVGTLVPGAGGTIPNSKLVVNSLLATEMVDLGGGTYTAALYVDFDKDNLVRSRKPIKVPIKFTVDMTVPGPTRPFLACLNNSPEPPAGGFSVSPQVTLPAIGGAAGVTNNANIAGAWDQCFISGHRVDVGTPGSDANCTVTNIPAGSKSWRMTTVAGPGVNITCEAACIANN